MDERERARSMSDNDLALSIAAAAGIRVTGDAAIFYEAARRLSLRAQQPACPEGWRLAPVEPESEVLEAMDRVSTQPSAGYWSRVYAAMLAAAPEAPASAWRLIEWAPDTGNFVCGYYSPAGYWSWREIGIQRAKACGYYTHYLPSLPAPPAGKDTPDAQP